MSSEVKHPNYLTNILCNSYYTKDLPVLDGYQWHYLFVYDDLRKGYQQHDYLDGADPVSHKAYTSENRYEMKYLRNLNYKMPYMKFCTNEERKGYIRGELYRVCTEHLTGIDTLNNTGEMFFRVKLPIIITSHNKQTVLAWTYIGNESVLQSTFSNKNLWSFHEHNYIGTPQSKFYIFGGNK